MMNSDSVLIKYEEEGELAAFVAAGQGRGGSSLMIPSNLSLEAREAFRRGWDRFWEVSDLPWSEAMARLGGEEYEWQDTFV